jgi:multiple sugar transport system substrate-binding protein
MTDTACSFSSLEDAGLEKTLTGTSRPGVCRFEWPELYPIFQNVRFFTDHLNCQGTERGLVRLRGMTWQHRRAVDPLVETQPRFRVDHPGIEIEWNSRPLAGFEFQSVEALSRSYDLIVLDHPFMGDAARGGYLLRLDGLLAERDADYIGPSLATYRYHGAIYAVPIDAACQVAVFRPDLMARIGAEIPKTWTEVLSLGRAAARRGLKLAIALAGVHGLMTFFTLMAGLGRPCAQSPEELLCDRAAAREALALLRGLTQFCPSEVFGWNSIRLHEVMIAEDLFAYCPAVYCYATYAEADQRRPLRFADLPGPVAPSPRGSTVGGTGLAISATSKSPEAALAYAAFAAGASAQRDYARHHGQPARVEVWQDANIDRAFGGCFAATRATLEGSWTRPRYPGYLGFQERGGMLIEHHLRGDLGESELLAKLQEAFAVSGDGGET